MSTDPSGDVLADELQRLVEGVDAQGLGHAAVWRGGLSGRCHVVVCGVPLPGAGSARQAPGGGQAPVHRARGRQPAAPSPASPHQQPAQPLVRGIGQPHAHQAPAQAHAGQPAATSQLTSGRFPEALGTTQQPATPAQLGP